MSHRIELPGECQHPRQTIFMYTWAICGRRSHVLASFSQSSNGKQDGRRREIPNAAVRDNGTRNSVAEHEAPTKTVQVKGFYFAGARQAKRETRTKEGTMMQTEYLRAERRKAKAVLRGKGGEMQARE